HEDERTGREPSIRPARTLEARRQMALGRRHLVERRGIEPLTFRLPAHAPDAVLPGDSEIGARLSSGLSSEPARDPLALAQELLAAAEGAADPATLIAAARVLVAEAAGKRSNAAKGGEGPVATAG